MGKQLFSVRYFYSISYLYDRTKPLFLLGTVSCTSLYLPGKLILEFKAPWAGIIQGSRKVRGEDGYPLHRNLRHAR